MDTIYKSFTDLEKNCKYITENYMDIFSQGYKYAYDVIILGTGENIYTLRFLDNNGNRHTFKTCDKFIIKWNTRSYPEHKDGVESCNFSFEAYGKYDNEHFGYLYNNDFEDNTLFCQDDAWKLQEIRFQLNNLKLEPLTGVMNEYDFIDKIMDPNYKYIQNFRENNEPDDSSSESEEFSNS